MRQQLKRIFEAFMLFTANADVYAATGGLQKATAFASELKLWFYGIVGVCAGTYILWTVIQCWTHRAKWQEFLIAILLVLLGGATLTLGDYLWGVFA